MRQHERLANPLRCVGRATVDQRGSVGRYGASEASLVSVVCQQLHTRPGGFIQWWILSARSVGTTSKEAIEQVAIRVAWKFEEDRGADYLKSVEADNIGFDLLSVKEIERRCIEVKGRAGIGMASLSWSEFAKAIELGDDYWLYLVLDCATPSPRLCRVKNPAKKLADHWKPDLNVQYKVDPEAVIAASEEG
jgi:hypothetical protein